MTGRSQLRRLAVAIGAAVVLSTPAAAQNASLEISQDTLNRVAARLGTLSDSGIHQPKHMLELPGFFTECAFFGFLECPGFPGFPGHRIPLARCQKTGGGIALVPSGAPVPWQWWVTEARFLLEAGALRFRADVRWRVGDQEGSSGPRTVDASIGFVAASNRLRVNVGAFTVPIQANFDGGPQTVATVDLARLYSLSIPIEPQVVSVPLPGGGSRTVMGRVISATPQYLAGRVTIDLDVGF